MWTEAKLAEDLRAIGLREGDAVLAHTSLHAVGSIEGGAETLLRAFRAVLGSDGTLMVPTFTPDLSDPADWDVSPPRDKLDRRRAEIEVFDPAITPVPTDKLGVFPEIVRRQVDALRSNHPLSSFAAIGAKADFLTANAPFHYPLGSESPLARLHQLNGWVLLLGVDQRSNSSLHLAEVWANVPYTHRSARVKTGPDEWATLWGSAECSQGFGKVEPLLRQARLLQRGHIGGADSVLMRQRFLISMAVSLLHGKAEALLCDDPSCRRCTLARKFTAPSHPPGADL